MSVAARALPPVEFASDRWGLFLDLDGTLCPLVDRPEDVRLTARQGALLLRLHDLLDGALCIVSGRSLADLERVFEGLPLPLIGAHGAETRGIDAVHAADAGGRDLQALRAPLAQLAASHDGLRLEDKGHALAVHYRARPDLGDWLDRRVRALAADHGALRMMHGNRVIELLPAAVSKGSALQRAMQLPRFAGRRPVAVGDDVTDEDAFDAAAALDGFGIAVGPRVSAAARFRLPCTVLVNTWLDVLAGPRARAGA